VRVNSLLSARLAAGLVVGRLVAVTVTPVGWFARVNRLAGLPTTYRLGVVGFWAVDPDAVYSTSTMLEPGS
jgi:hypothetical protein